MSSRNKKMKRNHDTAADGDTNDDDDDIDIIHRKRLAQILRYIANMHYQQQNVGSNSSSGQVDGDDSNSITNNTTNSSVSFVRQVELRSNNNKRNNMIPNFFHTSYNDRQQYYDNNSNTNNYNSGVIFTTDDFRNLMMMEHHHHHQNQDNNNNDGSTQQQQQPPPAFNFYAAESSPRINNNNNNNNNNNSNNNNGNNRKRNNDGSWKILSRNTTTTTTNNNRKDQQQQQLMLEKSGCWLRLTRWKNSKTYIPSKPNKISITDSSEVRRYFKDWLSKVVQNNPSSNTSIGSSNSYNKDHDDTLSNTIEQFLTLDRLKKAPKIPPTVSPVGCQRIKSYLINYQTYLEKRIYYKQLQIMYNRLFTWMQENNNSSSNNTSSNELVWGLGHAKTMMINDNNNTDMNYSALLINGPLLEVLVQVELAPDGALLIRPRNHTGVALNRDVTASLITGTPPPPSSSSTTGGGGTSSMSAWSMINNNGISSNNNNTTTVLSSLHNAVAEMEPTDISPGQPSTYASILKRIALEMSPNGTFQSSAASASASSVDTHNKLLVTEAWCLYSRPKPSSVWARDANAFAEQLALSSTISTSPMLSKATYALTYGPASLDDNWRNKQLQLAKSESKAGSAFHWFREWLRSPKTNNVKELTINNNRKTDNDNNGNSWIFPLPSSDTQNRIAELLLSKNYPAVVCEGPPGTGKSHTIANMVCSYLCQGKRCLVTSKNSPALAVLRRRLPTTIQELCVDVSGSETEGMRHLQQTVEKLAKRIASVNTELERQKYLYLKGTISDIEKEIEEIDIKLSDRCELIRKFVRTQEGQKLVDISLTMINEAPWLTKSMSSWSIEQIDYVQAQTERVLPDDDVLIKEVTGYDLPVPDDLINFVACKAGSSSLLTIVDNAKTAVAHLPLIGSRFKHRRIELDELSSKLMIRGCKPQTQSDWKNIVHTLEWIHAVDKFQNTVWYAYQRKDKWPKKDFINNPEELRMFDELLRKAQIAKQIELSMNMQEEHLKHAAECRSLDARRTVLSTKLQSLAVELVDVTVVAELSQNFSSDAQSALIRFAQLAGKQNFSQGSSKLSKMTQRQRRRRQEYLDAFDRCCRFIPCWIMTTSQISDYLPPECLFDIAIIDESSQSDITALPGMLRGRQWLIVGDGKQVSPTESFISEDRLDILRASLPPDIPFENSMLPGQSFFDLCAQAFPKGRVVLNEHFRCAPEIISFSNNNFYNRELVPMRLPTKSERIIPSITDIKVRNGKKIGKSNNEEAIAIIRHVKELISTSSDTTNPRSIGIISLMGSEQSQIIRSGLLEAIGPHQMARHNILVGDPPTFQGAERDIIFLSMVCSKGSAPTQCQLMHFQRANVAMSRARDQLILYRSIEIHDIPSSEDMKIPILEFFQLQNEEQHSNDSNTTRTFDNSSSHNLLERLLTEKGYKTQSMGKIWKNGVCVEHPSSDIRIGLIVECIEDSIQEWNSSYKQQKAIERVGWTCMRVDVISLVVRVNETVDSIVRFLRLHGIEDPSVLNQKRDEESLPSRGIDELVGFDVDVMQDGAGSMSSNSSNQGENNEDDQPVAGIAEQEGDGEAAIIVSSDDDSNANKNTKKRKLRKRKSTLSDPFDLDDTLEASNFGETVELDFLLNNNKLLARKSDLSSVADDQNGSNEDYWSDDEPRMTGRKKLQKADAVSGPQHDNEQRRNQSTARRRNGSASEKWDGDSDTSSPRQENNQRDSRRYPKRSENNTNKINTLDNEDEEFSYDAEDDEVDEAQDDDWSPERKGRE